MKKILVVMGTRPEAIKMAPVIREIRKFPEQFDLKVCITAQHREQLDQILDIFSIRPDYDLNIMQANQTLDDITINILAGMREVLNQARPDLVLVHGDTTTTFTVSLSAFYQQIPVGHVEAGLRTGNRYSPYPEEINRQLTSRLATWHFAPTGLNRQCLLAENIPADTIMVTGNTVIDALFWMRDKIRQDEGLAEKIIAHITESGYPVQALSGSRKMLLVTGHRRENFGAGFLRICEAIKELARRFPFLDIVYPVHLNPNVRKPVHAILQNMANVYLIEPLPYEAFVSLMGMAHLILTDSGGIQEESPSLGKPTVVMREITERQEAIAAGTVKLVGTDKEKIINTISGLLTDPDAYQKMACTRNPYGDGKAAGRIVDFLRGIKPCH